MYMMIPRLILWILLFPTGTLASSKLPHPVVELFYPYFKILGKVLDEKLDSYSWKLSKDLFHKVRHINSLHVQN